MTLQHRPIILLPKWNKSTKIHGVCEWTEGGGEAEMEEEMEKQEGKQHKH